jgi:hypothetical protein
MDHIDPSDPRVRRYHWDAAVDADGSAVAVWVALDNAQTGDSVIVRSARRAPDGSWQVIVLSDGFETAVRGADLHLGPGGALAAAWVACTSVEPAEQGPCHVRVRRKPADAEAWLPVEHADATSAGEGISDAHVRVGPGGVTTVLWEQADTSTPATWAVMARSYTPQPAPGGWDPAPTNLSGWNAPYVVLSVPVIDPEGTVTSAWTAGFSDPAGVGIYASTRAAKAGTWSGAVLISSLLTSPIAAAPTLAAGQDGTVAAGWYYYSWPTGYGVMANVRDAGSVWGTEADTCGQANEFLTDFDLAVGADGSTAVLCGLKTYARPEAANEILRWTVRNPKGAWGDGGQGALTGWSAGIQSPRVRTADDGSVVAAWGIEDGSRPAAQGQSIFAASKPAGEAFGDAVQVSDWAEYAGLVQGGLAGGRKGRPVAMMWYAGSTTMSEALFFSEMLAGGNVVYVPLVLYRSP